MTFKMSEPVEQQVHGKNPNLYVPEVSLKVERLPSKSLSYPQNCTIRYRPYLFGEVKKVSGSTLSKTEQLRFILEGVECNFDKLDLTFADALYIGFLRQVSTYGSSEFIAKYICSECGDVVEAVVKTDKIEFKDIKASKLPIITDISGEKVEFRPFTVKNYFTIVENKMEKDEIAALACCTNLDFQKAYQLISHASPDDFEVIEEVDKYLDHSMSPVKLIHKKKVENSTEEEHENSIELDGGQALMLPFRGNKKSVHDRICFGY